MQTDKEKLMNGEEKGGRGGKKGSPDNPKHIFPSVWTLTPRANISGNVPKKYLPAKEPNSNL